MIFSASKNMYQLTLLSKKTLTTRLRLPAHIREGARWAIVPRRAAPAWWISSGLAVPSIVTEPREEWRRMMQEPSEYIDIPTMKEFERYLLKHDYVQAAIVIDDFWQTPLQQMTRHEAVNEGVRSVDEYAALWDKINDKAGVRWADNPQVWRIAYHTPLDVHDAVMRVGEAAIWAAWTSPAPVGAESTEG